MKMLHTSCCLEGTRHSARDRYPTFLTATVTVLDTWGDSWSSLPAAGTTVSLVSIPVRLSPNGSVGKESICNAGDTGDADSIPGLGRSLEKEMATHSGILAWKISWTEDSGGLRSMESQRVGHNWVTEHTTRTGPFLESLFHSILFQNKGKEREGENAHKSSGFRESPLLPGQ